MLFDLLFRIRSEFRRRILNAELGYEMEFHLEQETEKLIRSGLSPEEASRKARIAFGFGGLAAEESQGERGIRWFADLRQDIAFGLRMLRVNPGFAAVSILSLALGIGANTAIFQLLDAVRLRNLPVPSPDRLYAVQIEGDGRTGNFTARFSNLTYAQWQQMEEHQKAFSSIGVWSPRRFNLADGGEVRPAEGMLVSGAFFDALGITARAGRLIEPGDDSPGCGTPAAVISDAFWQREFGGSPQTIGSVLHVDGHPFTIAGVTKQSFLGVEVGRSYDIAIPLCAETILAGINGQLTEGKNNYWLTAIGRLRDGWTDGRADAQLRAISPQIFKATLPSDLTTADARHKYESMRLQTATAGTGFSWLRFEYQRPLWILLGSASLVLLIACGNLANLLLARASARRQEMSVRLSLGASRSRLVRQLLTESFLLASAGAALGLVVAIAASRALVSFLATADNPVVLDMRLDWRVLGFTLAVALTTCVLFGLASAFRGAAVSSGTRTAGSRNASVLRQALVIVQVALCIILVAGAFLFGRSAYRLLTVPTGFQAEGVLIASLDTRRMGLSDERQKVVFSQVLDRLRAAPGVMDAARSTLIPMSGWESRTSLGLNGEQISSRFSPVSSGYFQTLHTRLLAGRDFSEADGEKSEKVAIVNEAFARKFLGGRNPVGQILFYSNRPTRIVGMVANTKYQALKEEFEPVLFIHSQQVTFVPNYVRFVVRSHLPIADTVKALQFSVASVSPLIDIEFEPLDKELRQSVLREQLLAFVGGGFGLLAIVLAAVGLYGLLSYSVEIRRSELGIRLALGAAPRMVVALILREAGLLLGIGIVAGLVATIALARTAEALLYGLRPNDPATLAATVAALVLIGLVSAYLPARRAARLDPLASLRQE